MPVPGKHVEAYLELEALQAEGRIKSIGVSNYVVEDIEELMQTCSVMPAINQIEVVKWFCILPISSPPLPPPPRAPLSLGGI